MNPEELFNLMNSRRTIRRYLDIPVPEEQAFEICMAGMTAPSAGNLQNWHFVLVGDFTAKKKMADACYAQYWMEEAAWHIVVYSDNSTIAKFYGDRGTKLYAIQNTAAACQNMLLMIHAMGLSGAWIGAFERDKVEEIAGGKGGYEPVAIIVVGHGNEIVPEPPKKRLFDCAYHGSLGAKRRYPWTMSDWRSVHHKTKFTNAKTKWDHYKEKWKIKFQDWKEERKMKKEEKK